MLIYLCTARLKKKIGEVTHNLKKYKNKVIKQKPWKQLH